MLDEPAFLKTAQKIGLIPIFEETMMNINDVYKVRKPRKWQGPTVKMLPNPLDKARDATMILGGKITQNKKFVNELPSDSPLIREAEIMLDLSPDDALVIAEGSKILSNIIIGSEKSENSEENFRLERLKKRIWKMKDVNPSIPVLGDISKRLEKRDDELKKEKEDAKERQMEDLDFLADILDRAIEESERAQLSKETET